MLVDRQGILDARDPVVRVALLAVVEDADGHPGNLEFLGQLANPGVQALVDPLILLGRGDPGSRPAQREVRVDVRAIVARLPPALE